MAKPLYIRAGLTAALILTGGLAGLAYADTAPTLNTVPVPTRMRTDTLIQFPDSWNIHRYVLHPGGGDEQVVVNPVWLKAPTAAEVEAAWPKVSSVPAGKATLRCHVRFDGVLQNCRTMSETPVAEGFGPAAIRRLSGRFRMAMPTDETQLTPNFVVDLPFQFAKPGTPQPAVTGVSWSQFPSYDRFSGALKSAGLNTGGAVIACTVAAGGGLTGCRSESESAPGAGQAITGVAGEFRVGLWSDDGLPTIGSRIKVPVEIG